jgi:hypothetical protein
MKAIILNKTISLMENKHPFKVAVILIPEAKNQGFNSVCLNHRERLGKDAYVRFR